MLKLAFSLGFLVRLWIAGLCSDSRSCFSEHSSQHDVLECGRGGMLSSLHSYGHVRERLRSQHKGKLTEGGVRCSG